MELKKRIGIFCYYDNNGEVDKATIQTIMDLKKCLAYLIIVVNGSLKEDTLFRKIADEVVFRENKGYDAGAYKIVICSAKYKDLFMESDELVLCNSSFYGPFISFDKIFKHMEDSRADFWGLSMVNQGLVKHIQSYFLVYRKKILDDRALISYFDKYIDEEATEYNAGCYTFENGLFHYLENYGYYSDAYIKKITCDNYRNPYGSLALDKIPVLKKKIFTKQFYNADNVGNAIIYAVQHYDYLFENVIDSIINKYGIKNKFEESVKYISQSCPKSDMVENPELIDKETLHVFISKHDKLYIYGVGNHARDVMHSEEPSVWEDKLKGFLLSEGREKKNGYFGKLPVFYLHEMSEKNAGIIVAMGKKNAEEVRPFLEGKYETIYLY